MANYSFLDATGTAQTAASSVIGGVNYPIVKVPDVVAVSLTGASVLSVTIAASSVTSQVVRNDNLTSVTSANLSNSPQAVGSAGETISNNAPYSAWVQGNASVVAVGGLTTIIPAQGASVFTYITSGQVANASANNVYLTMFGATNSVIGYLPVPANSGALPLMPNGWKTSANGAFSASISGISSVFLSFQGFISKT